MLFQGWYKYPQYVSWILLVIYELFSSWLFYDGKSKNLKKNDNGQMQEI